MPVVSVSSLKRHASVGYLRGGNADGWHIQQPSNHCRKVAERNAFFVDTVIGNTGRRVLKRETEKMSCVQIAAFTTRQ